MFTRDMAISQDGKEIYFCVAISNYTYATIVPAAGMEEADWDYNKLVNLLNSPNNGNADIYWMNSQFLNKLKEKHLN